MNLLVALKPVGETDLNPFDEIALEAALRCREANHPVVTQLLVATVGPIAWEGNLRTALAMGADQAILVEADAGLEPLLVAKCLAALAKKWDVDLLLTGRQAVDRDQQQTGAMTAALLGWGQATGVAELSWQPQGLEAIVVRVVDDGLERWSVPLPAVVTVDIRLNGIHATGGPRYASLPNILRARRHPLHRCTPEELGIRLIPQMQYLGRQLPPQRPPGKRLQTVSELVAVLQNC